MNNDDDDVMVMIVVVYVSVDVVRYFSPIPLMIMIEGTTTSIRCRPQLNTNWRNAWSRWTNTK